MVVGWKSSWQWTKNESCSWWRKRLVAISGSYRGGDGRKGLVCSGEMVVEHFPFKPSKVKGRGTKIAIKLGLLGPKNIVQSWQRPVSMRERSGHNCWQLKLEEDEKLLSANGFLAKKGSCQWSRVHTRQWKCCMAWNRGSWWSKVGGKRLRWWWVKERGS